MVCKYQELCSVISQVLNEITNSINFTQAGQSIRHHESISFIVKLLLVLFIKIIIKGLPGFDCKNFIVLHTFRDIFNSIQDFCQLFQNLIVSSDLNLLSSFIW